MADLKDLFIVFLAGLFVGWIAREVTGASVKQYSNEETWEFIRDLETGRTKGVKVHRAATDS